MADIRDDRRGVAEDDSRAALERLERLAAPIPEACRISGLSRSELYRRLGDGSIRAVKSGARTLIIMDSLRAHFAGLPAATFRSRVPG